MASFSYGLNAGAIDTSPDQITVGTLAVSTNDVELRVDKTKSLTKLEIIRIVEAFVRRLEDERFNDPVSV
jgi:hypothetical protein